LKRWAPGTYHGLRRKHVDVYLNEFVFRYNRRVHRHVSFETGLGLAAHRRPETYRDIIQRDNPRQSATPALSLRRPRFARWRHLRLWLAQKSLPADPENRPRSFCGRCRVLVGVLGAARR
jgi:hypothetical protein